MSSITDYKLAIASDTSNPTVITDFFNAFYTYADDPKADAQYADSFTQDATLIIGPTKVQDHSKILEFRKTFYSGPVRSRKHILGKLHPFDKDGKEVMLYGIVQYGLTNGKGVDLEWAARANLVQKDGKVQMSYYQVYSDSSPVAKALQS